MCLKVRDKTNGKVIVLQLTPKVDKDMYLFVSGSKVINSNTSVLLEEESWQNWMTVR